MSNHSETETRGTDEASNQSCVDLKHQFSLMKMGGGGEGVKTYQKQSAVMV